MEFSTIKMIQTVSVPMEPLFEQGKIYHTAPLLAQTLVTRGHAELVKEEKKETKKPTK